MLLSCRRLYFLFALSLWAALTITGCIYSEPTPRPSPAPTVPPEDHPTIKQEYLLAQFQMELLSHFAQRQPHDFLTALTWSPPAQCLDTALLTGLTPEELPPFAQQTLGCLHQDLNAPADRGAWRRLNVEEKEKKSRELLETLWLVHSPSEWLSWQVKMERGFAVAPDNNPALDRYAATYRHCRPSDHHTARLAEVATGIEAAREWRRISGNVRRCVNIQHEANFPLEHQPES